MVITQGASRFTSGDTKRNDKDAPAALARIVDAGEHEERTKARQSEAAKDRELILRFNGGDEGAFNEIVARYGVRIHALAGRFLRNHADAEEIVQDTFIRAHRGLATFRGDSSLATWLHRIAVNLARNRYWYFFRRRRHLTLSLDATLGAEGSATFNDLVPSEEAGPSRRATNDEFVALVDICMTKLDISHREILKMRNQLHRSYHEIARALGINEGTVKSRIARARGKLRDLMTNSCPEFATTGRAHDWFEISRDTPLLRHAAV